MQLDTEEDYERLGEHLCAIDGPLANFATAHGYVVSARTSGGRYPNRRITQAGIVSRSVHIAMGDQPDGQRFVRFFPAIPYTISAGAWIDDHERHQRRHAPFLHTCPIPFSKLVTVLPAYLDQCHNYLARVTAEHIYVCKHTSPLSPLPPHDRNT